MKIAITGSNGYVGNFLAQFFTEKGIKVVGLSLESMPRQKKYKNFKFIHCDIRNKQLLKEIFEKEKITHVLHLAYLMNPQHNKKYEYDVDVNGSKYCFDAANETKTVKQFVVFSSASIYGGHKNNKDWLKETDRTRPRDWVYAQNKKVIENYYNKTKTRMKVVILRMCTAVGPSYYKKGGVVSSVTKAPFFPLINGEDPKLQFIHEDDVNNLLDKIVNDKNVKGTFNLAPDSYATLKELAGKKLFIPIPNILFYPIIWLLWNLRISPLSPTSINLMMYGIVVDPGKLMKRYSYKFKFSTKESFKDAVEKRRKAGTL